LKNLYSGKSKKDFQSKISIAYKEARETRCWLNLLQETKYINKEQAESLLQDNEEICKIIGKIKSTIKKQLLIK